MRGVREVISDCKRVVWDASYCCVRKDAVKRLTCNPMTKTSCMRQHANRVKEVHSRVGRCTVLEFKTQPAGGAVAIAWPLFLQSHSVNELRKLKTLLCGLLRPWHSICHLWFHPCNKQQLKVNNGTWGGYLVKYLAPCWLLDISQIPPSIHVLCVCRHRSVHLWPCSVAASNNTVYP